MATYQRIDRLPAARLLRRQAGIKTFFDQVMKPHVAAIGLPALPDRLRDGEVEASRSGMADDDEGLHQPYWFIELKKSALVLAVRSLSSRNSMASTAPIGIRMRRSTHILESVARSTSSSSLRVPDLVMSMAGKVRLSATLRSRMISELPVPLNSSKITSSMREPVSISAVAMMVSEPPSSMLRAAPKNRFGRCKALASTPPVSTLPDEGTTVL